MKVKHLIASSENVKSLGRNIFDNNILYLIHSASSIEFTFTCNKLYVNLSAMLAQNARIAVFINGVQTNIYTISANQADTTIEIINSDKIQNGIIKIVKMTEAYKS